MGFTLNQHEQEKQIKRLQQKEDHDTTDYESLENLPEINGVELKGNKSLSDLGIQGDSLEAAGGEILTLDPTSEGRALLHSVYGMSVQDGTPTPSSPVDIVSAKADFRSVGKNLIPYPYYDNVNNIQPVTGTNSGITWVINDDNSITFTGEATNDFVFYMAVRSSALSRIPIKAGKYKLVGCPAGGSTTTYDMYLNAYRAGTSTSITGMRDTGEGIEKEYDVDIVAGIYIEIKSGYAIQSSLTFKPMLRLADVTDSTYEPYTKHDTTTDLTLRAIEVSSSDAYNLVRDGKYYIADTLDYDEDNGWSVTRRVGHIASYDSESIITKWMSSKDVYASGTYPSAGAVVDYILTSETTETITTEQALALLGLKTYDESTTISSQAEPSCTIAVEYAKERLGALALTAYNKAVADGLSIAAITPHLLPDAPSTDGSYNLKVTVTSGEPAYSWEAVTP